MLSQNIIRLYSYVLLILLASLFSCSHQVFVAPMPTGETKERVLAILPFEVVTKLPRIPRGATLAKLKENEKKEGYTFQRDLYRYFLRSMSALELSPSKLQDFKTTNQIIDNHGIQYEEIRKLPKQSLAELLEVDGIISGYIVQRVSNEGSFIVGLLDGAPAANKIEAVLTLHEKRNGDLLWRFEDKAGAKGGTMYDLAKNLLREVPGQFPLIQF